MVFIVVLEQRDTVIDVITPDPLGSGFNITTPTIPELREEPWEEKTIAFTVFYVETD